jgi:hypothetical protein
VQQLELEKIAHPNSPRHEQPRVALRDEVASAVVELMAKAMLMVLRPCREKEVDDE